MTDSPDPQAASGRPNSGSATPFVVAAILTLVASATMAVLLFVFRVDLSGATLAPVWSCQRPLLVDIDGDGIDDPVGRFVDYGKATIHVAAFRGSNGEPLWVSASLQPIGMDEERLSISIEQGCVRVRRGEEDSWLRLADGEPTTAPEGAQETPNRKLAAGWPFPDERRILHTSVFSSRRRQGRGDRAAEFAGFERGQELVPPGAVCHVSFGELDDGSEVPALVGYRPTGRLSEGKEAWRVVLGADYPMLSHAPPGFTSVDCDTESVVAIYRRGEGISGNLRASLVDIVDGERAWDVAVPDGGPFASVTLCADRAYVSTLGGLVALDREDGSMLFEIAPHRF